MRQGNWFQTFSGTQFFLTDPHPDDVSIEDIAHALSLICRFGGHTRAFYSVAEHSVRCYHYVASLYPSCPILQLHTLLHDASEAYLGDVVRPLKVSTPFYADLERRTMRVIYDALGVPPMDAWQHEIVKDADNRLLMTERRDLIRHRDIPWSTNDEPLPGRIEPYSSKQAELMFLAAYRRLT